jgi:hypothetical protein
VGLQRIGGDDRAGGVAAGAEGGGGHGQDGDQPMAAATGRSRVEDSGEVGQQVRGLGVLEFERVGRSKSGEGGWDRG